MIKYDLYIITNIIQISYPNVIQVLKYLFWFNYNVINLIIIKL